VVGIVGHEAHRVGTDAALQQRTFDRLLDLPEGAMADEKVSRAGLRGRPEPEQATFTLV
jgi:hypothetical protein